VVGEQRVQKTAPESPDFDQKSGVVDAQPALRRFCNSVSGRL
jgi:hypothetical protein